MRTGAQPGDTMPEQQAVEQCTTNRRCVPAGAPCTRAARIVAARGWRQNLMLRPHPSHACWIKASRLGCTKVAVGVELSGVVPPCWWLSRCLLPPLSCCMPLLSCQLSESGETNAIPSQNRARIRSGQGGQRARDGSRRHS